MGRSLTLKELAKKLKSLSDPTRLRILNLLFYGELCVCDIQHVLDMPQPLVSRHLSYLKNVGLVNDRRDGFRMFYKLLKDGPSINQTLVGFLKEVFREEKIFHQDLMTLREAVKDGNCQIVQSRAFPRISNPAADNSRSGA
jgi:ArsR family transcriptional regulator, arsenate/arsenite/antimonite-responsive transcriptional repressor